MRSIGGSKKASTRSDYWRDLIQQQATSGQSVSAFCAQRGLTEQSLYYWKKRVSKEVPVRFALVTTGGAAGTQGAPLELEFSSGQRLRIPGGVDPATLRTVLAVLRERA